MGLVFFIVNRPFVLLNTHQIYRIVIAIACSFLAYSLSSIQPFIDTHDNQRKILMLYDRLRNLFIARIAGVAASAAPRSQDSTFALGDWQGKIARLVNSDGFNQFIIVVIILTGIQVGMETYEGLVERYAAFFHVTERIILAIFVVEMVLKILARGKQPWRYFADPWNVFDFIIVMASLLPFHVSYVAVLRMLRVLRVFRLFSALPKLQMIVGALLRSIPSMGYVTILLGLLFYIYAVLGVFNYGGNDPLHFGTLQTAFISLFQSVTMDGWSELMYTNMLGCDQYGYDGLTQLCTKPVASPVGAPLYFISFMITGAMIILNFFIGVILTTMDEVNEEAQMEVRWLKRQKEGQKELHEDMEEIAERLRELQDQMRLLTLGLKKQRGIAD
ncbi:MAG: ion transporter [Caldilineaceae bacterium]